MKEAIGNLFLSLQHTLGMDDATFMLVLRGISVLLTVAGFAAVVFATTQMRRPTRLRWFAPILGMAMSVLGSLGYMLVMQPPVNVRIAGPLIAMGLLLGFLQGWQTRVYWENERLMGRRTVLYMGLWGFAYLTTQGLAQLQSAALHAVGVLTMMLTVGIAIGSNINLATRQAWMRIRPAE